MSYGEEGQSRLSKDFRDSFFPGVVTHSPSRKPITRIQHLESTIFILILLANKRVLNPALNAGLSAVTTEADSFCLQLKSTCSHETPAHTEPPFHIGKGKRNNVPSK